MRPTTNLLSTSVAVLSLYTSAHAYSNSGSSSNIPSTYNCGAACADYTSVLSQVSSSDSNCVNTIGASCGSDGGATINDVCMNAAMTIAECYKCSHRVPRLGGGGSSSSGLGLTGGSITGSALPLLKAWKETCETFEKTGDKSGCCVSVLVEYTQGEWIMYA